MFLGWYDADKKYPTWRKLADALGRYQDKFGNTAATCLTSVEDAAELRQHATIAKLGIAVVGADYIPRHTFYVGVEDIIMSEHTVMDPYVSATAA